MRSSSRIIRGQDAADLPSWSVDLIGSHYQNPVERMMSEVNLQTAQATPATRPLSAEETRLKEWEDALVRREAQLRLLERDTLKEAEEKGQQAGYEAGWNTAHNERVALVHAAKSLEDEFSRFKSGLSEKLLDLAVLVSKKVIADTVTMHPEQAALLLNQVLDSMQLYSKAVTLRAHPNTLRVLEAQFGDQKMLSTLRLMEDATQLQGGFILQHPEGEVDATLQTRWLRAIETLGKNSPITPDDLNSDPEKDNE